MTWLYWLIGIALLIFGIGMIPATLRLELNDRVRLVLRILFYKRQLVPKKVRVKAGSLSYKKIVKWRKKQEQNRQKKITKSEKKSEVSEKQDEEDAKEDNDFVSKLKLYAALIKSFLQSFAKHFKIKILDFRIVVGADDAAKTAILYGIISQNVSYILELLNHFTNVRVKRNERVEVCADFAGDEIKAEMTTVFTLRVWHVFAIAGHVLATFIKTKIQNSPNKTTDKQQENTQKSAA